MVRMMLYPLTAATNARPMPVLPLVGSIRTVLPGVILPSRSAASIMARPMRSFTLLAGLRLSSLTTTVAGAPSVTRFSWTRGVLPIRSVIFFAMFIVSPLTHNPARRRCCAAGCALPRMKQRPMRWQYEVGSTEKSAGRCCDAVAETPCDLHPIQHDRNWPAKTFATVLIGIAHHSN